MLGPLMIDLEGPVLTSAERELLSHPLICGVILFARNYVDCDQLCELTRTIRAVREPALLIAVDQEGGRVQRFRNGFVELPSLGALGLTYDMDEQAGLALATDCAWLMAIELRRAGVDFSFAPVLDLRTQRSTVIGDRAFHRDPSKVARLARAYREGLHSAGMAAVGKHFPGHGTVAADSHLALPVDEREWFDLDRSDLLPFRALVGQNIEGLMMAHVVYPAVDAAAAGYSSRWIRGILRREMGFEGAVFSDDLSMVGAEGVGGFTERAQLALTAGCDVLLVCNHRQGVVEILDTLDANTPFPGTQARLLRMRARGPTPDFPALVSGERWRATVERIVALNPAPELALRDDNLLG